MGSGAPRFRLCTHNDMKQILVTLLLLGALLAVTEGKRRGGKPKKVRSGRGGERSWHIAGEEGETSCGNSTEIFTTETPSSLCTEAGSNFCICATRGDLEDEEEEVTWKYTCGSCDLKWKPERDEEAVKKRKQEKKKISAEAKARKKEMRRKMRQKLKGREGRQEKMKRRKQSHRAAMAESQNEEE